MRFLEESNSETESEVVVSRGWGERGAWGIIFSGCRAPALQDENILEAAGGNGWLTECRY